MKITFTDNVSKKLIDVINPSLSKATEIKFGVAFVKYSGYSLIDKAIRESLKNGGKAEFLLGLDFRTTEPSVLKTLLEMAESGSNVKLLCFSDPSIDDTPVYHPKIYLLREEEQIVISIGSSNLTAGGLKDNVEVNAIIEASMNDEIVSDIYGVYNILKFQKDMFEPDLEYVENYEKAYEIVRKRTVGAFGEQSTKGKIRDLKEREKTLPKPKPVKTELYGWQKLVYEKLPGEPFHTRDMYIHEREFQQFYPENRHIKDKIRQILQQLRDLGLLIHRKNKWSKV